MPRWWQSWQHNTQTKPLNCLLRTSGLLPRQAAILTAQFGHPMTWPSTGKHPTLDWGLVDMALYHEAFTGRVRTIVRYSFCLSDTQISVECPYAPVEVKTPEARLSPEGKMSCPPIRQSTQGPRVATVKICRLFNNPAGSQCRFPLCRYAHLCIRCRSPHPAAECSDKQRSGGWAHSPPPQLTKS